MKRTPKLFVLGWATTLAVSSAFSTVPAFARSHHHHRAAGNGAVASQGNGNEGPLPGPRGLFAGAGGIYSPDYETPGGPVYHLGAQILGGDFGKAYEDYYRHYYYYKYAYCPIGTSYFILQRRCVGLFNLTDKQ